MTARTMAAALTQLDELLEAVKDKDAQIKFLDDLTKDLLRIIATLEAERDTWRARSGL